MIDLKYMKDRARAAKWIASRKDGVGWWRWTVLTQRNPDRTSPKLDENLARHIFVDLAEQGLMVPCVASDGAPAYTLNLGSPNWPAVMKPPTWWRRAFAWSRSRATWLVATAIAAAIAAIITKAITA